MRVRAATRPGTRETRLANTTAPRATAAIAGIGTVGWGTAEIPSANSVQSHRPRAIPIGTPASTPTTAATEDCHATEAASCRWVNPKAFKTANWRRR